MLLTYLPLPEFPPWFLLFDLFLLIREKVEEGDGGMYTGGVRCKQKHIDIENQAAFFTT
jgi:hypothetical protein